MPIIWKGGEGYYTDSCVLDATVDLSPLNLGLMDLLALRNTVVVEIMVRITKARKKYTPLGTISRWKCSWGKSIADGNLILPLYGDSIMNPNVAPVRRASTQLLTPSLRVRRYCMQQVKHYFETGDVVPYDPNLEADELQFAFEGKYGTLRELNFYKYGKLYKWD